MRNNLSCLRKSERTVLKILKNLKNKKNWKKKEKYSQNIKKYNQYCEKYKKILLWKIVNLSKIFGKENDW